MGFKYIAFYYSSWTLMEGTPNNQLVVWLT